MFHSSCTWIHRLLHDLYILDIGVPCILFYEDTLPVRLIACFLQISSIQSSQFRYVGTSSLGANHSLPDLGGGQPSLKQEAL